VAGLLVAHAGSALAGPEGYFSPRGGIRDRLLRAIRESQATIDLALFDFTSRELARALLAARGRGITIRIVTDSRQAQGRRSEIPRLIGEGIPVRLTRGQGQGLMHHKFAIFDGRLLVTGSYNWTDSAECCNREDALLLDDPRVIGRYQSHFEPLFHGALGRARLRMISPGLRPEPTPAGRS